MLGRKKKEEEEEEEFGFGDVDTSSFGATADDRAHPPRSWHRCTARVPRAPVGIQLSDHARFARQSRYGGG